MKKMTLFLAFFFVLITMNKISYAQETSENISLEAGLGYGSEIQSLGIQAGGFYTIDSQFRVGADAIYYLPGEDSNGVEFSWLEFNANGHYFFLNQNSTKAYALGGLNFSKLFSDEDNIHLPGGDNLERVYVGLNIGAGAEFSLDVVDIYIEGKYALSSVHQLALTGGVRIPL